MVQKSDTTKDFSTIKLIFSQNYEPDFFISGLFSIFKRLLDNFGVTFVACIEAFVVTNLVVQNQSFQTHRPVFFHQDVNGHAAI